MMMFMLLMLTSLAIQAPGYDAYSTTFDLGKERMAKEVALVSALAHLTLKCSTPGVGLYVNDQFKANASLSNLSNKTFTVKGVTFTMVAVEGGTFTMGATSEQQNSESDEKPTHSVTLSNFYIGQTEVTQTLWKAVMGKNPFNWKGDNLPVEYVSWKDCQKFITKLNKLTGKTFRLPTEAEWEYAARGGNSNSSQTNPIGPNRGSNRVYRGGSWHNFDRECRVSNRYRYLPNYWFNYLGLRLALSE